MSITTQNKSFLKSLWLCVIIWEFLIIASFVMLRVSDLSKAIYAERQ